MAKIPAKVRKRLIDGIKKYQPILVDARERAIKEPDTSSIVQDMLQDVFGYEKIKEITAEYTVKQDRCDLAIKLAAVLKLLIEVKGIMVTLKENHVEQAVLYTARKEPLNWAVLTNGIFWHVYRVTLNKKIEEEQLFTFDFTTLKPKAADLELLYLLCKEAWEKDELSRHYEQKQALGKHLIGAIIQTEPVLRLVRKILRRISPDAQISCDHLLTVLRDDVIIPEVLHDEDSRAKQAQKTVAKVIKGMAGADKPTDGKPATNAKPTPTGPG